MAYFDTDTPLYLFHHGENCKAYELLGAHPATYNRKRGFIFRVWAPRAQTVSVVGDFNGWGADADLEKIAPNNWFIGNFVVETAGGLKFRANHDWGTNWGATLNVADVNYAAGVINGDNIKVPAGTYNVFFNDITGEFVFQAL